MPTKLTKKQAAKISDFRPRTTADEIRDLKVGEALSYGREEWPHTSTPYQYVSAAFRPERSDRKFLVTSDEGCFYIKRLS